MKFTVVYEGIVYLVKIVFNQKKGSWEVWRSKAPSSVFFLEASGKEAGIIANAILGVTLS